MESVWDYPRPPRLERTGRRITVRHAGVTVVDSDRCWRVLETSHPPVYYVPRSEVTGARLEPDPRRTWCEWKGEASYWDLVVGEVRVREAAWSYEDPTPAYADLAGAVAFYPGRVDECRVDGERVEVQPGDFYGGWITSDVTGPFKGAPGTLGW
ncbi:DUF427 domain-containing protein [Micromonospora sp. R77]|uniref:DUF427 domain-containing protein n=1 Tax=Micromonospora sp. R77 TaxID=2925836 RepID=UPI001F602705|nr:DUF427 domain-containing protein [Micromonospora sp. R77]MCI4065175.1 DUF427 domain-containing protein [Micromonospora sp. R77]